MMEVLQSGLYTSIQDFGRFGYRNYGVPISGVMDEYHGALANQILGNDQDAAVLEITLQGPSLYFHEATQIVICGADLSPKLNNQPIRLNIPIHIAKGDQLDFGARNYGVRAYLAVQHGFQTEKILGSRSFYDGITVKSRIQKGDFVPYQATAKKVESFSNIKLRQDLFSDSEINVFKGPEFDLLSKQQRKQLFSTSFSVGLNNRMAYQLNELVTNDFPSIITSAVLPGTIQLTPSGKLIILMKDCQTTGGYPRILQLDQKSISILSQKHTGDSIYFKML
ncbi:biotin-dependent carboxyltransferase family protein [Kordia sp. YSTF-M3]|uniref:Biotin-dependent carboxyltransferase family protein n=1 Tax=Kordia aestuariivivens TaxID=2759037 RepID=A0ABR7QD55_9FLAO|nr:biotin-dependent carboxyltransferase family protein [Kordia aestuariivivens]MBC8756470.1 biotin-dependent carboxyltransferase family protein [Kordia aestuariivivens]